MRYSKMIGRLCERMDKRTEEYITIKVNTTYMLEKEGDTLRLYHYGGLIGGVRLGDKNAAILGTPISVCDVRALNTLWKYYMVGRRAQFHRAGVTVRSINECTDNRAIL